MSQPARRDFRLSVQLLSCETSILSLPRPHDCQTNSLTQPAHFHHLLALLMLDILALTP